MADGSVDTAGLLTPLLPLPVFPFNIIRGVLASESWPPDSWEICHANVPLGRKSGQLGHCLDSFWPPLGHAWTSIGHCCYSASPHLCTRFITVGRTNFQNSGFAQNCVLVCKSDSATGRVYNTALQPRCSSLSWRWIPVSPLPARLQLDRGVLSEDPHGFCWQLKINDI